MNCDGCTECCNALPIPEMNKPENVMCLHCDSGCSIYADRPISCSEFNCVYALSEGANLSMRPDNIGVIFERVTTKIYHALITRPNWKSKLISSYMKQLNSEGISVVVSEFGKGLIEVFTAEDHEENKVVEISMRLAS